MNLIELHMLQSFPVNCLNRDQFGSPKSTVFGGVPRARISSQCWKRAIRLMAGEESEMFSGTRSKYFFHRLQQVLLDMGQPEKDAAAIAKEIVTAAGIKIDKDNTVKNLFYFSDLELQAAASSIRSGVMPPKAITLPPMQPFLAAACNAPRWKAAV